LSARLLGLNNVVGPLFRKDSGADSLRREIISGRIAPGERVVEARWATTLGVAQASVREAINTLTQEGFMEKTTGRSARVISLSPADIRQIYQLRAAMEGLAARLAAQRKADLTPMQEALDRMREAATREDLTAFYIHDLEFHIALCHASGNRFLGDHVRGLLFKLFAFYVMRLQPVRDNKLYWTHSLAEHEQIISVLKRGHPGLAEQHLVATIDQFFHETQQSHLEGGKRLC